MPLSALYRPDFVTFRTPKSAPLSHINTASCQLCQMCEQYVVDVQCHAMTQSSGSGIDLTRRQATCALPQGRATPSTQCLGQNCCLAK